METIMEKITLEEFQKRVYTAVEETIKGIDEQNEEYKKEKGDYYKIKNKETIEHNKVKKYFFEIINIFKK